MQTPSCHHHALWRVQALCRPGHAALIFDKKGPTDFVWFYEMEADGFSMSDTRAPILENDIPDIMAKWPKREEGAKSFRVTREELAAYNDELTPGRYRKHEVEKQDHGHLPS
ncbi:MAG: N-6 DNA methylase [Flavobacteriales bacterium]|nr:N-6 DNA methylase [Flavobacteriales bacterium]